MLVDDFSTSPQDRWTFVADTVMGGVSDGVATFETDGDQSYVRLCGSVSTDNNGGFIQVRARFAASWPPDCTDVVLDVRGNGETYYVFLRSAKGTRPWHSYRASFEAGPNWSRIRLPIAEFKPSRDALPPMIEPADVVGMGIVAYGADYYADVSVARIALE